MQPTRETLLCRYHYDALDRLVDCTPTGEATSRRFYLKERLATEIQGTEQRSIMQHDDQLLAQQTRQGGTAAQTCLLATDQGRSVLSVLNANLPKPLAYTPYGYRPLGSGSLSLLGFNGELRDPATGCYLLGTGHHRPFNAVLGRFICPDSWSPFDEGGLNAYAYCQGNPVNYSDPTGHMRRLKSLFRNKAKVASATTQRAEIPGDIWNLKKIDNEMHTFENKEGSKLTIVTHGNEQTKQLVSESRLWTADEIIKQTRLEAYDRVRILACHSDEIGAEIALKTGKYVKAYLGEVTTNLSGDLLNKIYNIRQATKNPSAGNVKVRFQKNDPQHQPAVAAHYQPVRFRP